MNPDKNPFPESSLSPSDNPQPVAPIVQDITQTPPVKVKQKKIILLCLIFLIVVVLTLLIGWKIDANEPKILKLTQTESKSYIKCLEQYSDKKLCQYYAIALNMQANRPVTITGTTTIGIGGVSKYVTETDSNGNTRLTADGTVTEIIVGGQTFYRTDTGWTKTPTITVPAIPKGLVYGNTFGIAGINGSHATFKYVGTITCANSTCYKYKVSYIPVGHNVYQTRYFWFDTKSYKLIGDSITIMSPGELTTVISNNLTYGPVPTVTAPPVDQ